MRPQRVVTSPHPLLSPGFGPSESRHQPSSPPVTRLWALRESSPALITSCHQALGPQRVVTSPHPLLSPGFGPSESRHQPSSPPVTRLWALRESSPALITSCHQALGPQRVVTSPHPLLSQGFWPSESRHQPP